MESAHGRHEKDGETPASGVSPIESTDEASEREAGRARGSAADGLRQTAAELAERIDEILEIAERTADEVRREAENSAEGYIQERRAAADRETEHRVAAANQTLSRIVTAVTQLSSSLRTGAERVLEEATGLEEAVSDALAAVAGTGATSPGGADDGSRGRPAAKPGKDRSSIQAEPLLLAAQMAARGRGREEIERALITEFGLEFPGEVVSEILGDPRPRAPGRRNRAVFERP